ncbi:MAG: CHASE2 domain-containing protein [Pyrinomonadaceae bacterium]|nr:CHASE2 domain-containing protein [Pyrinomonadaceae bacterium]
MNFTNRTTFQWIRIAVIWLVSFLSVLAVSWFAPSLSNAAINMLFRLRGELPAPENIVIVAIDDASLQRLGKFPWSRKLTADCLDKITAGNPKAVGIDVIYAEESDLSDDEALAKAIKNNGRVVLPVQLYEKISNTNPQKTEIGWLNPIQEFAQNSAAKGHAHAAPDVDGTLRTVQLSKSDDKGNRFWAFGLETLRVAEGIPPNDFEEKSGLLRFGNYQIKLVSDEINQTEYLKGVSIVRPNEMLINYIGASKSFHYFSFAEVLDGTIPPETFKDKIVLIGATSPTLGDSQVTPFMHFAAAENKEGGQAMPGVEVHANIINTIKNRLWLGFLPQFWEIFLAISIILGATAAVKLIDGWLQVLILVLMLLAIIGGSILAFNNWQTILPLPELLTAFLTAVPLLLIDRSLAASHDLDIKLHRLAEVQNEVLLNTNFENTELTAQSKLIPHNLEWKLKAVDDISTRLLSRMSFISRVLGGMNEGVIVADVKNQVVFVNNSLSQMFGIEPKTFVNQDFTDFFRQRNIFAESELKKIVEQTLNGKQFEKEFKFRSQNYLVRFSPVNAENDEVIGILVLLTDVTKQRELDRLKAETMQFVSHELRAPLTSIQSLSDVLRKFPVSNEESSEMLDTIHSEAIRLNELINRFLDIKRLESGAQNLQISKFNLNKLLENCVQTANPFALERQSKIHFFKPEKPINIQADAQLLKQAVDNLLNNAIKYSPQNSMVEITTQSKPKETQIIVKDKGFGIPKESLNRVFDSFYRLERDVLSATVGTGLGLSFVKEVAEKHHGKISVNSEEGVGSEFILTIPNLD